MTSRTSRRPDSRSTRAASTWVRMPGHPQAAVAVAAQHRPVGRARCASRRRTGRRAPHRRRARRPANGARPRRGARGRRTARPRAPRRRAGPGSGPRRASATTATPLTRPSTAATTRTMRGPMGPACADPAARVGRHPQVPWTRDVGLPDRGPRPRRRRLPRGLGAAATGARPGRGRRPAAHRPAARAPAGLHRRQAHDPHERPADPGGAPVIDVDRGGKITFHGPGQLVGYPIVALPDHVKVVDYVRRVEEALIGVCRDLGVETARVPGRSGVWLRADDRGARAQGRRDRHPRQPGRDHARLRPQLRRGPRLVRPVRALRHRRRRRHLAVRGARPPGDGLRRAAPRRAAPDRPAGVGAVRPRRPTTRRGPSRGARRASSCSRP